jgi:hypothetical protein
MFASWYFLKRIATRVLLVIGCSGCCVGIHAAVWDDCWQCYRRLQVLLVYVIYVTGHSVHFFLGWWLLHLIDGYLFLLPKG